MTLTVLDTSVLIYATFGHGLKHFADAIVLHEELIAPRTLSLEFAGYVSKQARIGRITADEARALWAEYIQRGIEVVELADEETRALQLALDTDIHAFDATYLLAALDHSAALATNDTRLLRAAAMVGVEVWAPTPDTSGTLEP